ncbi:Predicted exporter [Pantoea agglomerans]|uniref:Predicted exporter n=1 Tax=Enterobacter agglomerans TaxID=549 RepID=A0A379AHX8_ENTAG|nr:Predicted exporter [Pantoea agglomerans]
MVWGDDAQQTLQRLEKLAPDLHQAQQQGWLQHYRLLPLTSLAQQQRDLQLLKQAVPDITARLQQGGYHAAGTGSDPDAGNARGVAVESAE